MIGFLEALKEKLSFQKKTGQKICEAGQKEKKNEGRFWVLFHFIFCCLALDGRASQKKREKKGEERIEGWKKYFRRVWFNPSVSWHRDRDLGARHTVDIQVCADEEVPSPHLRVPPPFGCAPSFPPPPPPPPPPDDSCLTALNDGPRDW